MSDLRSKLIRLAHENPALRGDLLPLLKTASTQKTANEVATTILNQMGGMRRLKMMIGAKNFEVVSNGVLFSWPSKQPSTGNRVRITLDPSDTYTVEFSTVRGVALAKAVKKYTDIYNDSLVDIFERQTGLFLHF